MATPTRFPQGVSLNAPWQFFSSMGTPNPFYYHSFRDDFDTVPSTAVGWTITAASTGTAALTAGDGGIVTLSTAATNADFESIQRSTATYVLASGKKFYFVARLSLSDVAASAFVAGMMPGGSTTPFTNPANGVWISKASGSSVINLNVANNSVVTTTPFPTSAISLTNNVTFDVGIHVTSGANGNAASINASFGPNLVGYTPQSGTGSPGSTNRAPNIASTAALITTLQTTALAPIVAVQAGAAAVKTLALDFVGAFRER